MFLQNFFLILFIKYEFSNCIYININGVKTVEITHSELSDTVDQLKAKIQCQENLLSSEQTIIYHLKVLNDYSLLTWLDIKINSVLKLNHRKNIYSSAYKDFNRIIILIKFRDRKFPLQVYKYDYVKDMRARIYCQEDIPIYKLYSLYLNDQLLRSEMNLNDYNIKNMSIIEVKDRDPSLRKQNIYYECNQPGHLALTFDDGPSFFTETLLDILKENHLKVAFFVVGINIQTDRERKILKRIYNEGHMLGSHTWSHVDLVSLPDWKIREEMTKTDDVIFDILGIRPRYMRPPFGSIDKRVQQILTDMGYKIFIWNLDTNDWRYAKVNYGKILRNVQLELKSLKHLNQSYIVLQHDSIMETVQTQKKLINFIKSRDFRIVGLNECIKDADSPYTINFQN